MRFMHGRYGTDQLNNTMIVAYLVLYVLSIITRLAVFYWIALVFMFVTIFRAMSRQIDRRRAENAQFMRVARPLMSGCKHLRMRLRDKDHRYFKCPHCKQQMRVPRGKGRITVHCRSCGATFEEKS